ncbi:sigma-70 family RNA polymerase sigma factor [Peribacillus simplex]|uniref:sigma-70 family RNA polymerase sigma factor n=1 Tax=Peribacillus simplex TaxID=1478 RepID=UPI0019236453|nr:sigma-70 family RNA polymerase sigma factor [Peribacillus simplex]MBD8589757.1 sigma-70 family RNA polymerase sigma factor [Peribacillus simplex]
MSIVAKSHQVKDLLNKGKIMVNPLLRGFLEDEEYFSLFEKAILDPTEENKDMVEEVFKSHYEKIRLESYLKNLIRYYSIDFDKKVRKIRGRFTLSLDKPIGFFESFKDLIVDENAEDFDSEPENKTLRDEVDNELLVQALDVLTESQYKILDLIYIKNLSKSEIANLINSSPQNISQIHNKAIKKLKKSIAGENIENRRSL